MLVEADEGAGGGVLRGELQARFVLDAGGKHVVGVVARGIPVRVDHEVELELLERFGDLFGLARGAEGVGSLRKHDAKGVRLLGEDAHKALVVRRRPARLGGLRSLVPARELGGDQGRYASSVAVCLVLLAHRHAIGEDVDGARLDEARRGDHASSAAARNVEVAGDGLDEAHGDGFPVAVVLLVADAIAVEDAHGLGGSHGASDIADDVGVDSADLSRPFGGELLHVLGELVEARAPVLDEVVVEKVFADDDVQEGERKCAVGAGADRHPDVGLRRELIHHRTDVDELHAAFLGLDDARGFPLVDLGVLRVGSPDDQKLGLVELAGIAVCACADGDALGGCSLRCANGAVQVVRGAVDVHESAAHLGEHRPELRGEHTECLGGSSVFELFELVGERLDAFVPGAALELALALLAGAAHRVQKARGVVDGLHGRLALCAQGARASAPVVAGDGVAFHVGPAAVFDVAQR